MHPPDFDKLGNEELSAPPPPPLPPRPLGGLKRMKGTSLLNKMETPQRLQNCSSMSSIPFTISSQRPANDLVVQRPRTLSRTKTSIEPLNDPKVTPLRLKIERTPGGTLSKAMVIPKVETIQELRTPTNDEVTPPPSIRRTASGSMLLRQTPERVRRQEEEDSTAKRTQRAGSLQRQTDVTPTLKRKRTSSLTSLLTSPRRSARGASEPRTDYVIPPPKPQASPIKKRVRQDSESRSTSPLKKRSFISTATIRLQVDDQQPCSSSLHTPQPLRKNKSVICTKKLTEMITLTYGTDSRPARQVPPVIPPKLVTRSTSGDTYHTASEGECDEPTTTTSTREVRDHEPTTTTMVPLVKKQISIDEKILEDEEDEGFGDSTKTIKRGQGAALARSLSLKLSPRKDQQKPIGADTEKSCSTPSLPTAPLIRQPSTSSLRFQVSPSTFLRPLPVADKSPTPPPQPKVVTSSEPSTSKMDEENKDVNKDARKSALKKGQNRFVLRDEHSLNGTRRRNVRYDGLKVYYFDRRQGESTVPSEGEVSLGMHHEHHTHRYFPLSSGKRPVLDLSLYDDDDLSDGEVIHPDSDGEHEYEEFSSAKHISAVHPKFRIKMLKKSGVKVEKSHESVDVLRKKRIECGCSCENGVCLPATCQCAIDGIQCQVDGGEYPTVPCACFAETCTNPNGRIFYDPDAVQDHRTRTIMNWKAAQRIGVVGSPTVKKFADSDDEEEGHKKSWLLKNAIPIKLESSPAKYPVTPVYTRRSRSSLSDIRESISEPNCTVTPSTLLSERMKAMQHLENEVCNEVEKEEDETIEPDLSLQEVYVAPESAEEELLEAAMSPVQTTLVV